MIRTLLTSWTENWEKSVSFSVLILIRKNNDNPNNQESKQISNKNSALLAVDFSYWLKVWAMRSSFVFSYSKLTMKVTRRIVILILTVCLGFIVVNSVLRLNSKQTSTSSYDKENSTELPSITICLKNSHSWANKTIEDIHEDANQMAKHFKADIWMSQDFRSTK